MTKPADKELAEFQADLLESVRQMKQGKATRTTTVPLTAAANARARVGLTQAVFAALLGVSLRTLQDWEQGRREPSGATRPLLRIVEKSPAAILAL